MHTRSHGRGGDAATAIDGQSVTTLYRHIATADHGTAHRQGPVSAGQIAIERDGAACAQATDGLEGIAGVGQCHRPTDDAADAGGGIKIAGLRDVARDTLRGGSHADAAGSRATGADRRDGREIGRADGGPGVGPGDDLGLRTAKQIGSADGEADATVVARTGDGNPLSAAETAVDSGRGGGQCQVTATAALTGCQRGTAAVGTKNHRVVAVVNIAELQIIGVADIQTAAARAE